MMLRSKRFRRLKTMATMQCEASTAIDLWARYRSAFREFARCGQSFQSLKAIPEVDPNALATAFIELERSRLAYNRHRDALVRRFLP
jgi:hypothetical protein